MTEPDEGFGRVVLGLGPYLSADPAMLRYVADFAGLLGAELHGLIIEDKRLSSIGGLPCTRVFQRLQDQWQRLEAEALQQSIERRIAAIRNAVGASARTAGVAARFEGVPTTMEALLAGAQKRDIIVIAEPGMPADCVIHPVEELASLALSGQAAVLLVPNLVGRRRGAILALARDPEDPAIHHAALIAAAAKEPVELLFTGSTAFAPPDPRTSWGPSPERLIVMGRVAEQPIRPLAVALKRRVPVLVLSTGKTGHG